MKQRWIVALVLSTLASFVSDVAAQTLSAQLREEDTMALAKDARAKGDAVRGAILFPQKKLGCATCHNANAKAAVGPDLTRLGKEANDAYLIEALLEPSKVVKREFASTKIATAAGRIIVGRLVQQTPLFVIVHEGAANGKRVRIPTAQIEEMQPSNKSAMPDGLVDQLASRQEFLDLMKYVMELANARNRPTQDNNVVRSGGKSVSEELRGLALIDDLGCANCHRERDTSTSIPHKRGPKLTFASSHLNPNYLQRFIADPQFVKPHATMPNVLHRLSENERLRATTELTHYIVSLTKETFTRQPIDDKAVKRGRELFHSVGCVACHSPRDDQGRETLTGDSVALGNLGKKYNVAGLTTFLENPHVARPSGRMPNMQLTHWEATDIANYLLRQTDKSDVVALEFTLDEDLAAKGKRQFVNLDCAQCHQHDDAKLKVDYLSLSELRSDRGCLSGEDGPWPKYTLTNEQRSSIRTALKRDDKPLDTHEQIQLTLHAFRCLNCHQRDEYGGVSDNRSDYFATTNQNLGPQGRIPPTLTNVGAKLNPKWLRQVLVSGRTIRPYMKTRMPQHGAENIGHLVDLLSRTDKLPSVEHGQFKDQKKMREAGHKLAGTEGLNCIACHTFQLKPALTMPAVDLTEMAERLQKDWFYHYMRDPQRLSSNTVMPTFFPGGRAIRNDVLEGDRDLQIEALWQWMIDGRQARQPRGLRREPIELLATDEAVMLRRAYRGIGKRGIGVGYPNQVNLAFDAEQMRLGLLWKGKFADPAGVWLSQGHGTVRPLARDVLHMPKGPDVDDADDPWVVDDGRPSKHRFLGYSLDEKQRPIFKYRFEDVEVTDYFVDEKVSSSGNVILRRTLTLSAKQRRNNVALRVGAGKKIERVDLGYYLIDEKLRVDLPRGTEASVVTVDESKTLRVTRDLPQGTTKLSIEYSW